MLNLATESLKFSRVKEHQDHLPFCSHRSRLVARVFPVPGALRLLSSPSFSACLGEKVCHVDVRNAHPSSSCFDFLAFQADTWGGEVEKKFQGKEE